MKCNKTLFAGTEKASAKVALSHGAHNRTSSLIPSATTGSSGFTSVALLFDDFELFEKAPLIDFARDFEVELFMEPSALETIFGSLWWQ